MVILNAGKEDSFVGNSEYPTFAKLADETPPKYGMGEAGAELIEEDDASVNLKTKITRYRQLQAAGNEQAIEAEAQRVAEAMRHVGDQHTDEKIRRNWYQKARDFYRGEADERTTILGGIGKGLLAMVAAPIALGAAGVFTAGAMIYGMGTLIRGIGTVMTGGMLKKRGGGGSRGR
ncbi:hypothetical protein BD779DRAFT_1211731 [Infundibulicybe gibba]|nr:hypothetical protein BD779DRAFT_1211731 [Infundibulicybe gibba]